MKLNFKKNLDNSESASSAAFTLIRTLAGAKNLDNAKAQRAFTLIELLVVISIIGILVALSFVGFMQARKSARDSQRKANLEQIRSALEIYRTDCKTYPADIDLLLSADPENANCKGETYMATIPSNPVAGQNYAYSGSTNTYTLCAFLETITAGVPSGCGDCGVIDCNYSTKNP